MKRFIALLVATLLVSQLAACGTILYPERRGQPAGRIDPAVAVLDGVGLLFFIVPGVVAFGVDFATGAIYLPGGNGKGPLSYNKYPLPAKGKKIDEAMLERAIAKHTGKHVDLSNQNVSAQRMDSRKKLLAALHRRLPGSTVTVASARGSLRGSD